MHKTTPQIRVLFGRCHKLVGLLVFGVFLFLSIFTALTPQKATAVAPSTLNFQARLMTAAGAIVPDGNYNVEFKLYNSATVVPIPDQGACTRNSGTLEATCLWTETRTGGNVVQVKNGYLTVNLGSVNTALSAIDFSQQLWLTMRIGGIGTPSWDPEMNPRLLLTGVPYAFKAADSATLGGISSSGFIQNQTASPQASSGFNISGNGLIGGNATVSGTYNTNTFTSSALTFGAAGTATIQSAASQALNITGNAASTVSTSAGNLTLQAGSGTVSLGSSTTLTNTGALTVTGGTTLSLTSTGTNAISLDSGTTGAVNIGTNANAKTVTIGNVTGATGVVANAGTGNISLNTTNASGGTVVKSVTSNSTGAFQVQNASNNSVLSVDTSAGAVGLGTSSAVTGKLLFQNAGNANTVTIQSGTTAAGGYALTLPTNAPALGQCLQNDGTTVGTLVFASCFNGTITGVGAYVAGNTNANGATVSGSNIVFQSASTSAPGMIDTAAQTIAGLKTFNAGLNIASAQAFQIAAANVLTSSNLTLTAAGATTVQSVAGSTSQSITLQSGNASAGVSGTVTVDNGTFTSGTPTLNLGNTNAKTIQIGNTTNTTTVGLDLAAGGTLNIANGAQTHTINIGAGGAVQTIHIGDGAAANVVTVGSGTGAASTAINAGTAGLAIGNNGIANTIQVGNTTGAVAQTVNIGNNATGGSTSTVVIGSTVAGNVTLQSAATIAIGNNAAAQTLNIGNVTGTTVLNERVGSGGYTLDGANNSNYTFGNNTTTGTIAIGGSAQTGTMTLGNSSATNILNIANGSGATTLNLANVQTGGSVNIGAAMTTGTISIGGTGAQTGALTIGGGTGAQALAFGASGTGAKTITIGGTGAPTGSNGATTINAQAGATNLKVQNTGAIVQTYTNSSTAFQVQNSVGAPVLVVDTTAPNNLLSYPGFEVGSPPTGWSAVSPGTIAQNATKSNTFNGLFSLALTTTASNGGATSSSFTGTVAAGTYTVSFYVKPSTAMNASGLTVTINDGTARTCSPAAQTLSTTGFIRVSCTPAATTANLVSMTIAQNDSSARTIYIDAVQLQSGSSVTPYQVGSIQLRGTITNPVAIQTASDSTTAFQIQNSAGTGNLFVADTLNGRLGVGTALPAEKLDIEGGNVRIGAQTNSTTAFSRISGGTPGTLNATTGATLIDNVYCSVVYNGSLYVGTEESGKAEVYRYDGGTIWTRVTSGTAGTINTGGTSAIDDVSSMVVYNGYLYIGTFKSGAAEVYRYDGGTTWAKVSGTAGTIATNGSTAVAGVEKLVVFNGSMYAGTVSTANLAEVDRYDGGTTWTKVSAASGTFVSGGSAMDAVTAMAVYNNALYVGTSDNVAASNGAEIYRYDGGTSATPWTRVNSSAGTIVSGGTSSIYAVESLQVYNGALYAGTGYTATNAEVYRYEPATGNTVGVWVKVSAATAGTFCGDSSSKAIAAMVVYNGRLYAGSEASTGGASVCRYDGDLGSNAVSTWTRVSSSQGTISSGSSATEEQVKAMTVYNGSLYVGAGTNSGTNLNKAEIHVYTTVEGQSYALNFNAASNNANAEQNGNLNLGSISFVGEVQNGGGSVGNNGTGSFLFSHGITTANGSYDLAEDYPTRDDSLEPGDLVAADPREDGLVKKANGPAETVVGIYSEKPGLRLSQTDPTIDGARAVPIALAGRVPLKVTSASGDIKAGDYLAASSIPGVAVKATHPGPVVGRALASYSSSDSSAVGKVMVLINLSWFDPSIMSGLQSGANTTEATGTDGSLALQDQAISSVSTASATSSVNTLQSGNLTVSTRLDNLDKQTDDLTSKFKNLQTTVNDLGANVNSGNLDLSGLGVKGNVAISQNLAVSGKTTLASLQLTGHFLTGGDAPTFTLQPYAGIQAPQMPLSTDPNAPVQHIAKATITGNDTSGKLTITIGDIGPDVQPGDVIKVTFNKAFDGEPQVIASPRGKDAAQAQFYVNDVTGQYFTIAASGVLKAGTTYTINYFSVQ